MQANPDKFQAVAVGIQTFDKVKQFTLAGIDIPCEENVKLLGVEVDFMLNYDKQIKTMCMKAARQLNVLRRLSKFLSEDTRLLIFMPPTLKKWGTYWFRLVRMYVCMYVCIHVRDIVLKLHVWIPHGKIADAYFWFSDN